jgi:preprotein translocase subunit SecG
LTGALTLNAEGNPNAVFIFKIGSTLTTASSSTVSVIGGGQGSNVFWQVGSSATLGTTTTFVGDILALTSITLNTGANIACGSERWSRLSEQIFRVDKWSLCRG